VSWNDKALAFYQEPTPSGCIPVLLPKAYFDKAQRASLSVLNPGPGGGESNSLSALVAAGKPVLTALEPSSRSPSEENLMLTIKGVSRVPSNVNDPNAEGFEASSVVYWNGNAYSTVFISPTEIQTNIPAHDIQNGTNTIYISNPYFDLAGNAGEYISNKLEFDAKNPVPTILGLYPSQTVTAAEGFQGDPPFNLVVSGSGFVEDSIVTWDRKRLTTSFRSYHQLVAAVSASEFEFPATHSISVISPQPGGGLATPVILDVVNASPILAQIAPAVVEAGSSDFVLTLTGQGFYSGSKILLNGIEHNTTFKWSREISVNVLASDVASAGVIRVSVTNTSPGGGVSKVVELMVQQS